MLLLDHTPVTDSQGDASSPIELCLCPSLSPKGQAPVFCLPRSPDGITGKLPQRGADPLLTLTGELQPAQGCGRSRSLWGICIQDQGSTASSNIPAMCLSPQPVPALLLHSGWHASHLLHLYLLQVSLGLRPHGKTFSGEYSILPAPSSGALAHSCVLSLMCTRSMRQTGRW